MSTESKTMGNGTSIGGKWLAVTFVLAVIAFMMSPNAPLGGFWGARAEGPAPAGVQMLLFVILGVIQSLAFGLGVAFLIFGWPLVNAVIPAHRTLGLAAYLAIAWSLISWWPHSSFHQTLRAGNISGLLAIEYAFHVTLIFGGLIVACFFLAKIRQAQR